jgi:hypothetical protein
MSAVRVLPASATSLAFLAGSGETGARLRSLDWSSHPLGLPEFWPQSLNSVS